MLLLAICSNIDVCRENQLISMNRMNPAVLLFFVLLVGGSVTSDVRGVAAFVISNNRLVNRAAPIYSANNENDKIKSTNDNNNVVVNSRFTRKRPLENDIATRNSGSSRRDTFGAMVGSVLLPTAVAASTPSKAFAAAPATGDDYPFKVRASCIELHLELLAISKSEF